MEESQNRPVKPGMGANALSRCATSPVSLETSNQPTYSVGRQQYLVKYTYLRMDSFPAGDMDYNIVAAAEVRGISLAFISASLWLLVPAVKRRRLLHGGGFIVTSAPAVSRKVASSLEVEANP